MIRARVALFGMVRSFVENELCGIVRYDQLEHVAAEPAVPPMGRNRHPHGRYREIVVVRFRNYELTAASSEEEPPLGLVTLRYLGGVRQGPLDQRTWKEIGAFVRERAGQERVMAHG